MKYLNSLLVLVSMLLPTAVWAQATGDAKNFVNIYYKSDELYVGQYTKGCVAGNPFEEGTCIRSEEIKTNNSVRGAFNNALNCGKWVSGTVDATKMQSSVLNLATDIDFGQTLGVDGKCSENYSFVSFTGLTFNGQNKTISNLCRVDNGYMDQYVGLFGEISGKTVKKLKISKYFIDRRFFNT